MKIVSAFVLEGIPPSFAPSCPQIPRRAPQILPAPRDPLLLRLGCPAPPRGAHAHPRRLRRPDPQPGKLPDRKHSANRLQKERAECVRAGACGPRPCTRTHTPKPPGPSLRQARAARRELGRPASLPQTSPARALGDACFALGPCSARTTLCLLLNKFHFLSRGPGLSWAWRVPRAPLLPPPDGPTLLPSPVSPFVWFLSPPSWKQS